jgi:expansin (peptidoglycan-binding protein)
VRHVIVSLCFAACSSNTPSAASGDDIPTCTAIPAAETGDGTYYNADGTGNCSFDASPDDLMVAAMNATDYANAAWCGACLAVTGPKATVTVRVVDQCPGCQQGDLDLSPQAFQQIADLSAGRVTITWHEVDCGVTGPIGYRFKEGSNAFWTAIQIRNARYPIAKLEARDDSGAWSEIPREDYNYFVQASGLGDGPYALRVTDARGHVIEDDAIALADAQTMPGSTQFPTCP